MRRYYLGSSANLIKRGSVWHCPRRDQAGNFFAHYKLLGVSILGLFLMQSCLFGGWSVSTEPRSQNSSEFSSETPADDANSGSSAPGSGTSQPPSEGSNVGTSPGSGSGSGSAAPPVLSTPYVPANPIGFSANGSSEIVSVIF